MREATIGVCVLVLVSCQGSVDLPANDRLNSGGLQGTCASECQNDSYCDKGQCVPYGSASKSYDSACGGGLPSIEELAIVTKCSWTKANVEGLPLVADLDGDKQPEIVFVAAYDGEADSHLVAIRSDTCAEVFNVTADLNYTGQLAIADLDGDKRPEIIGPTSYNDVAVFNGAGQLLAVTNIPAPDDRPHSSYSAIAIANLDGQGPPEIVCAGLALRYANGALTTLYNVPVQTGTWGNLSAVEDVDLDSRPEVLIGNQILDGLTGADKTPASIRSLPGGYAAIAQWDKSTPEPEVVLVTGQMNTSATLRVFHPKTGNVVFGPFSLDSDEAGPPAIADFDGDGEPELGAATHNGYALFDRQCATTPLPSFCHAEGIRWLKPFKDPSLAQGEGSAAFDFDGDGAAEVVSRDECWLRVRDGRSGKTLLASSISSFPGKDMPTIADVDQDGHAEIVVSGDDFGLRDLPASLGPVDRPDFCAAEPELNLPWTGGQGTKGVFVLEEAKDRWMPARPIWNQQTYHLTNINDDATVPLREEHNWLSWNSYRQNVSGTTTGGTQGLAGTTEGGAAAADLTASSGKSSASCSSGELAAQICNRGAAEAPAGIPGTFYAGDPRSSGKALCTAQTSAALSAGECEAVRCKFASLPQGQVELWFRADDDGQGEGKAAECKEQNNLLQLPELSCHSVD